MYPSGDTTKPDPLPKDCPGGKLLLLFVLGGAVVLVLLLLVIPSHTEVTKATEGDAFLTTAVTLFSLGVKSFSRSSTDVLIFGRAAAFIESDGDILPVVPTVVVKAAVTFRKQPSNTTVNKTVMFLRMLTPRLFLLLVDAFPESRFAGTIHPSTSCTIEKPAWQIIFSLMA
jgi:hypothetical protein